MTYMVMECYPSYAILLDEEGRFLKAANLNYTVGQIVEKPVLMREEARRTISVWIGSGIAAIAACFLLIFGIFYYQNYLQLYSSIYLTINPEILMDLNRQGEVISLVGMNEDGKDLLEGYDGKGKDKVTVADELVDRAIEMGYLSEGGRVSISIDAPDEAVFQEYGVELRTQMTEYLDGRISVIIEVQDDLTQNEELPQSSTPAEIPTYVSKPAVSAPSESSKTDVEESYSDTDYGPENDGVTDYDPPESSEEDLDDGTDYHVSSDSAGYDDTDYGPRNDGVTDYNPPGEPSQESSDGDTNYNDHESGYSSGDSVYEKNDIDDNDDDDDNDE